VQTHLLLYLIVNRRTLLPIHPFLLLYLLVLLRLRFLSAQRLLLQRLLLLAPLLLLHYISLDLLLQKSQPVQPPFAVLMSLYLGVKHFAEKRPRCFLFL
jgi:hypothetical protein